MSTELYKGFTLNIPGGAPPWGIIENPLFKDIIDDLVLNTTHRTSDGKDHSDVILNNTHRTSSGTDHSDVVLNTIHRTSDGSDHTFLNQTMVIGAAPNLVGTNFSGIPSAAVTNNVSATSAFGADNRVLRSNGTAKVAQGSGVILDDSDNITLPDGASINLQEVINFTGATTENKIGLVDNLAVALDITEAGNMMQRFITTNTAEAVQFGVNVGIGVVPGATEDLHISSVGDCNVLISASIDANLFFDCDLDENNKIEFQMNAVPQYRFFNEAGGTFEFTDIIGGNHIFRLTASGSDLTFSPGGNVALADGVSLNLQEAINFTGATTENLIGLVDNLAVALDITEAGNMMQRFITTNTVEAVHFGVSVGIGAVPGTNDLLVSNATTACLVELKSVTSDTNVSLTLNPNMGANGSIASINFEDNGTPKWRMYTDSADNFHINDEVGARDILFADSNGDLTLMGSGGNIGFGVNPVSDFHFYRGSATVTMTIESVTDNVSLKLDSGTDGLGGEESTLSFLDDGNFKWQINKDASNNFAITDNVRGANALDMVANGDISFLTNQFIIHDDGNISASLLSKVYVSSSVGVSMTNNDWTTMTWNTEEDDHLNEMVNTTGIYTAAKNCTLDVKWRVRSESITWANAEVWGTLLSKNNLETAGNSWAGFDRQFADSLTGRADSVGSATVDLDAGETLRLKVFQDSGSAIDSGTDRRYSYMHITQKITNTN